MKIRTSLTANLIGQGWTTVLNLAAVPFYIHFLGIDAFGLIGLYTVVIIVVSMFDAGMTTTLNREMVRYLAGERSSNSIRDLMRSVEIICGGVGLSLILLSFAFGPVLAAVWIGHSTIPASTVGFSLTMMIVASVLRVVEAIYRAALLGLHRPVLMNTLSVIFSTLRIAGILAVFAVLTPSLRTFFIWQVAVGTLTLVTYIAATHRVIGRGSRRARFDPAQLRGIAGFAGNAFAISALGVVLTQADKVLVPRLVSLRDVGYYSAAVVIATGINQLVLPIFHSFYPRLSFFHATTDRRSFEATYLHAARLIAVVAGCPIAIFLYHGHDILLAWTAKPDVAAAAAPLLRRMAPGALAFGLYQIPMAALLAADEQRVAVQTMAVAAALIAPMILTSFALAGLVGVATAWSLVLWLVLVIGLVRTRRQVLSGTKLLSLVSASFLPVAVAITLSGLLQLLPTLGNGGRWFIVGKLVLVSGAVLVLTTAVTWNSGIATRARRWRSA